MKTMKFCVSILFLCFGLITSAGAAESFGGRQFIGFDHFDTFKSTSKEGGTELLKEVRPDIEWNELVVSWNYDGPAENGLEVQVRLLNSGDSPTWYSFGLWSLAPGVHKRESIKRQRDDTAAVDTDTLKLKRLGGAVEVRVLLRETQPGRLKFLGLSFCDSNAAATPAPPNTNVWGKSLVVKERSQANYPEGISTWCSPTSTSMLLSYWSTNLNRGELDYDVPEVARAVNDPNWPGTGNWPFNMAFAGSHKGMRAYVTRFSDISEIEAWIQAGIPVAASVSYNLLKGRSQPGNGHLVVCIGFDENGNPVFNDPGRKQVRQTYDRENFRKAWAVSENTVYLVYPEDRATPVDKFDHWHSARH